MSDLISRQAAIDAIDEYIEKNRRPDFIGNMVWVSGVADAMRIVSDLPSIQEQRWIPVTEALPKDDEEVIVTCLDDSGDTPFSYTTVAWHFKGTWICNDERCFFITAWMPLPEPWKEGRR